MTLVTITQLESRLGDTLAGADLTRAEAVLDDVSERAKSIAERPEWDSGTVPAAVVGVILAAARRVYVNPDRYLSNMAGQFSAQGAADQFSGGYFMDEETAELVKHRPHTALRTATFYRDQDGQQYPGHGYTVVDSSGQPVPLQKPILLAADDE